jgi:2-oxoglutarate ferredoxin oxidoreductase subunit alpha
MQRLLRKFDTAKQRMPAPVPRQAQRGTPYGIIYFGSTAPAMNEALAALEAQNRHLDALRVRAFPFDDSIAQFIRDHDSVFVVEQNRDAQLRTLLIAECGVHPARLVPVLHYDGTPITARFITAEISERMRLNETMPHSEPAK